MHHSHAGVDGVSDDTADRQHVPPTRYTGLVSLTGSSIACSVQWALQVWSAFLLTKTLRSNTIVAISSRCIWISVTDSAARAEAATSVPLRIALRRHRDTGMDATIG